jgi:hypothetical protein
MSVSKRLRFEILRRDNHACRYCGATAPDVKLTVDHVLPVALGGSDKPDNLVTACHDCNSGKSSSNPDAPIVDGVSDDALRWASAIKQAAEIQAESRIAKDAYVDGFFQEWASHCPSWADKENLHLPSDWVTSIERQYDAGIELDVLCNAVRMTMRNPNIYYDARFRYLFGILRNILRERHEIAQELIEVERGAE